MRSLFLFFLRIFFLCLFLSHLSFAKGSRQKSDRIKNNSVKSKFSFIVAPYQPDFRYVKTLDAQMQWQQGAVHSLGLQKDNFIFFLDYANSTDDSGNQALAFRKDRVEVLLSGYYLFYSPNEYLGFAAGLGAGLYEDTLKSRLLGQEITERTGNQILAKGSFALMGNWNYFFYSLELGGLTGRDYDPQPTLTVLLRLGLQFTIF